MTVRNIHSIDLDHLRAVQHSWQEAEFNARAAFALIRLDTLDLYAPMLTPADCFDAAYSIWDDYIDGRRADERGEPMSVDRLGEAASIFARVARHIGGKEAFALAQVAWASETFEVFTATAAGVSTGKLGWYQGNTLFVTFGELDQSGRRLVSVETLRAWRGPSCKATHSETVSGNRRPIALHPMFARVAS